MANVKLDGKTMPEATFRVTSRGCKDSYGLNNLQSGSNVELVEYNGAKAKVELTTDRENGKIVKPTENNTPLGGLQCHQCDVNQNRLTDEQYLNMTMDNCFNVTLGEKSVFSYLTSHNPEMASISIYTGRNSGNM